MLTVCSLAWQVADKLGVVRRCEASSKFGDLRCAFAICSALILYFSHLQFILKSYILPEEVYTNYPVKDDQG